MGQVITALFENRSEAEAVQNELRSLGIVKDENTGASRGSVYDSSHQNYRAGSYSGSTGDSSDRGFWGDRGWDDDDYRIPDADRHEYEEGVHRGNTLLTVTVDDEMCDRARDIIEKSNAHDVDTESSNWRNEGWRAPATVAAGSTTDRYYTRNRNYTGTKSRSYSRGDVGNGPGETSYKASGYANEALGNVKQGIGNVTGNESLRQSGLNQERKGEQQQREGERRGDRGNEF